MDTQGTSGRSGLSAAFADQLRAERAAARLSQVELASRSGLSQPTIKRLEANTREFDTDQLSRVCDALGITVMDFVTRATVRMAPHANAPNVQEDTRAVP